LLDSLLKRLYCNELLNENMPKKRIKL